jgi:SAM-dependent methyltransferase
MWNNVWEELFSSQAWGKYPAEPLIRFIARNFYSKNRANVRILELGCGPGANLWYLAREGFSFKGVDGSATAIQQATDRLDSECAGWRELGQLEVGDITKVDLGHEVFDAVIDNECVYCMPFDQSREIYAKARAALKRGGGEDLCQNIHARNLGIRYRKPDRPIYV